MTESATIPATSLAKCRQTHEHVLSMGGPPTTHWPSNAHASQPSKMQDDIRLTNMQGKTTVNLTSYHRASAMRPMCNIRPDCYPSTTEELPESDRSATEDPKMLPMCSLSVPSRHALPKCPDIQGTCVLPKCNLSATSMCYLSPTYLNVCYLSPTYVRPTNYLHATECYLTASESYRRLPMCCLSAAWVPHVPPKCYRCATNKLPKRYIMLPHVLSKCCRSATHALPQCDRSAT